MGERAFEAINLLFGNDAKFRSRHQKEALIKALEGVNPLATILPTGMGKSVVYLGPAVVGDGHTTVVMTPSIALTADTIE